MSRSHDPTALAQALDRLQHTPMAATEKGFLGLGPVTPAELSRRALRATEAGFATPIMVLRQPALMSNVEVMARWCRDRNALLAPHAKTTMVPQVIAAQLRAGAWGSTVANVSQLAALYELGVRRFLIANPVTDAVSLRWLARARTSDPELDFACYVDSEPGVDLLAEAFQSADRPMSVLVELGFAGGRTGVRGIRAARELARYAEGAGLRVGGVACFEGVLGHDRSSAALSAVRAGCRELAQLAELLGPGIISAGGSFYFDVITEELGGRGSTGSRLVLRSGGYAVQDYGYLSLQSPLADRLQPAFETWAAVLSRPEPGLAILGAGKRDLPFDLGMPTVLGAWSGSDSWDLPGAEVRQLDDQHAYLAVADPASLTAGDVVRLGGAHPCTAFDKWRAIPMLDGQDRVVDVARTLF